MEGTQDNKRSFGISLAIILLCIVALVGVTVAWFTGTASNTGNKIQAGTLQVDLLMADGDATKADSYSSIAQNEEAIFSSDVLWEPGQTQYAYLQVKNKGNLDLKYNMTITVKDKETNQIVTTPMAGAFTYAIVPSGHNLPTSTVTSWADVLTKSPLETGNLLNAIQTQAGQESAKSGDIPAAQNGKLTASQSDYFLIALHMDESAGNDYQGGLLEVDVVINAGQLASELDGFGSNTYDAFAELPATVTFPKIKGIVSAAQKVEAKGVIKEATAEVNAVNGVFNAMKVEGATSNELTLSLNVAEQGRKTVEDPQTLKQRTTVDLSIDMTAVMKSVKDGQTTTKTEKVTELNDYVTIKMNLDKLLHDVAVSHKGAPMTSLTSASQDAEGFYYDSTTGALTIKSKSFSPFKVAFTFIPAALIGDKTYATVCEALEDTVAGCTVVVLQDETFPYPRSEGHMFDLADNVTINLNNHKISATNYGFIFSGNNLTIKNGTFEAVGNSPYYALFLGDRAKGTEIEGVTIDGVTCLGGVNFYKVKGAILKNTVVSDSSVPNEYNAIYAKDSTVTVESGNYQSSANDSEVLFNVNDLTIKGGNFVGAKQGLTYYSATLKISGGTFNVDPSASVIEGYVASKDATTGIWTVTKSAE